MLGGRALLCTSVWNDSVRLPKLGEREAVLRLPIEVGRDQYATTLFLQALVDNIVDSIMRADRPVVAV